MSKTADSQRTLTGRVCRQLGIRRRFGRARQRIARALLRAAELMSPRLAAALLFQIARRPPRRRLDAATQATLAKATRFSVRLHDRDVQVYSWGAGPIALCVHGWGGRAAQMTPFVTPLMLAGFRAIAFDAPAHGASGGTVSDPIAFAQAISAVVQAVGPAHSVIGHSLGAAAALVAAREGTLRPERLVLLGGYAHFDLVMHQMKTVFAVSRPVLERAFHRWFGQYHHHVDRDRLSPLNALRQLECPTFILHDHDDEVVPVSHAEQLLAAAKSGALVRTRGLGHHSILNDEVAGWCVEFLSKSAIARVADA
jgi:pimeloyl-ACP methyl ester carboxylesterase